MAVLCNQVNLQKSKTASLRMNSLLSDLPRIGIFQEPYTVQNKVVLRPQGYKVIPEATCEGVPRAALFIPLSLQSSTLGHLNTPDCAVAQLRWNSVDILLASVYLDGEDDVVQQWLTNLVEYGISRNMSILIGMDSNAHSSLYSSADTDDRGDKLEDFIFMHELDIANRGHIPTFQTVCAQSVIDVTLMKDIFIRDWHVDTDYNTSDHNTIVFHIDVETVPERESRPWKEAKWSKFTEKLDVKYNPPERMTTRKLDRELGKFYFDVENALDIACPKFKWTPSVKESLWYTDSLRLLHERVRRQHKTAMTTQIQDEIEKYNALHRKYRRRCRRARDRSWRKFVSDTPDEHKMALLTRIARHRDKQDLSVLYTNDGEITELGEGTIKRLAEVHFPQASLYEGHAPRNNDRACLSSEIVGKYEYISKRLVKLSLLRFKVGKAAGPDGLSPLLFRYFPDTLLERIAFLYECCIHFRYTPRLWQKSRVVFLPKPGKKDYRVGKNHRPIVLSNFLLKGLERLITWEMDKKLKYHPIHSN